MSGPSTAVRLMLIVAALAGMASPAAAQLGYATTTGSLPLPNATLPSPGTTKGAGGPNEAAGYLVAPVNDAQSGCHLQVEPYDPQPGDIILYDYFSKLYAVAFWLVGSDRPSHAAIVFDRPDGTPAILEVGPNSHFQVFTDVCIVEVLPRLKSYPGAIMVRRPHQPLSPEQSAALTRFALAQEGKKFAAGRLFLQATPFRCRCGLRHQLFAQTCLDRKRWICSENVVAAATVAGLLDPKVHFANCMYPRDLAYDEHYDLSGSYYPPVLWVVDPHPHIEGTRVEVVAPPEKP